ncbi:MAG: glycoside hydrolase family 3 protein [Bacteroidia bacterium]|nr:glycoside hydrolase family 3 protein [Bacteroidia bacterium]
MKVRILLFSVSLFSCHFLFGQVAATYSLKDFYKQNPTLDSLVNALFDQLNDTQRVGQMVIQATGAIGKPEAEISRSVKGGYLGGVIYLKVPKEDCKRMYEDLNKTALDAKTLPLLFTTDGEPSLINYKIKGLETFKKTDRIKTPEESAEIAVILSRILKDLGIRQNYAPVCDIAFNKEVINNRSYGMDKEMVIDHCKAFIRATQNEGVAATAKHFPGHGNVKGDSHINLVCIDGEMTELDTYKALIADSVLSVMVGHIAVKNNEKYSTDGLPSTCSKKIVTGLLRNELGFKGLIVTDGMNMGALGKVKDAAIKAVEAGCDMILIPPDEKKLVKQVLLKIATDNDFKNQVYESVKRIIRMKVCLGIVSSFKF